MLNYGPGPMNPMRPGVDPEGRIPAIAPGRPMPRGILGTMKKGGKVKKTGKYMLHKGEKVVPAKKAKMVRLSGLMDKDQDRM